MSTWKTPKGTTLYIIRLQNKDYLPVAERLIWFREEKPLWGIETEFLVSTPTDTVAKATIRDESGRVIATAHKSETKAGFSDHLEKGETGAIGRALALIGYGTQFTGSELDEGTERIVDAPRAAPNPHAPSNLQPPPTDGASVDRGYVITFGKYKNRSLEQVGPTDLENYVLYLEGAAKKKGEIIKGQVAEFIQRAVEYVNAFEKGVQEKFDSSNGATTPENDVPF